MLLGCLQPNTTPHPTLHKWLLYNIQLAPGSVAMALPVLLVAGGQVVNDDCITKADVLVENSIIKEVSPNLAAPPNARVIDATGKMVVPGGIDPHTHMQLPFMGTTAVDDFLQGTKAAVAGGTTMIIDFVYPNHGDSLVDSWDQWNAWAAPKVCCDYAFSVVITAWNPTVKAQMTECVKSKGVNSFKILMAYNEECMLRDDEMFEAFQHCSYIGALARVHAEEADIIAKKQKELLAKGITGPVGHLKSHPEYGEELATNRACVLAAAADCPLYIVHLVSTAAAHAIVQHKNKGAVVFGEALAAALGADGTHYYDADWAQAAAFVLVPPLSPDTQTPGRLATLLAGGQLDVVASDHCTFTTAQKAIGRDDFTKIPYGVNGVEDRLSVVWEKGVHSGKMDPTRFVAVTSSTAAKIFNIYPKKGRIAVGSDADIVVWNPSATRTISAATHHQAVDFNIFEGLTCHGVAEVTICGGQVVWEQGELSVTAGSGKLVSLPAESPYVFSTIRQKQHKIGDKNKLQLRNWAQEI